MTLSPGARIGPYQITGLIGVGGMGEVYRARDTRLHREVAIKLLPEGLARDSVALTRFAREARAASALNHPNIVTLHEIGEDQGKPFMVMELVEGKTLRNVARGRPLPVRRVLDIGAQLADGLAKAHANGIVHRDLKPDNVMVTTDGFVKILDFGLAKLRAQESGERQAARPDADQPTWPGTAPLPLTQAGAVMGTAGYMSPEQLRGGKVDYRTDQFSLGAILYELATGRSAFGREALKDTLNATLEEEPTPIGQLNPTFPTPARWAVERCLAKEPGGRYASTLDLARELRQVSEHLVDIPSSPPSDRAPDTRRRAALVIAALLLVVTALAGAALSPSLRERLAVALELRPVPAEKGIAVLPFHATSDDPEDRYRCDGVAETLTSRLAQLERFHGALWVVPASEVRQAGVTSAEAARRVFGVTLAVTGSVQRQGDQLRFTASLVDAVGLKQLRSMGPSDYAVDDLSLQDDVVEGVARMLDLALGQQEHEALRAGRTSVGGAYALYLEGRGHLQRYDDAQSLEKAVALFQGALAQDPAYPLAYAALGEAHWRLYRLNKREELVPLAEEYCRKALALNPLLAPVHVTLGIVHAGTGHQEEAVEDFQRALMRDPRNADAYRELGRTLRLLGRDEEAEAAHRKAILLRPEDWSAHNQLGGFLASRGRFREAEIEFRRVVELAPDNVRGHSNLGAALYSQGRPEEAEQALARAAALKPAPSALSNLGVIQFYLGHYDHAVQSFERAVQLDEADWRLWKALGDALYWAPGARARAAPALSRAIELGEKELAVNPDDRTLLLRLADAHGMLGESEKARLLLARALERGLDDVQDMAVAGSLYERLGEREKAIEWIARAAREGYSRWEIERDPALATLRADPRFAVALAPQ